MKTEVGERTGDLALPPPAGRFRAGVKLWLPVLLWMAVIFGFSTQAGSTRHTSRFIGPILRWLIPGVTDATIRQVQTVVRKGAHMAEYAVLTLLLWRARRRPVPNDCRPWRRSEATFALAVALLFAVSDELHQAFVPSREARVTDVLFDAAGASLGLFALHRIGRWRGRW